MNIETNKKDLEYMTNYLKVSPGSTIVLRGHADGSGKDEHRLYGGEEAVRELMMTLKNLSKEPLPRRSAGSSRRFTPSTRQGSRLKAWVQRSRPGRVRLPIVASRSSGSQSNSQFSHSWPAATDVLI